MSVTSPPMRSARLGLRATPQQEAVLRRAAEVAHKSLTDFILDAACQADHLQRRRTQGIARLR